MGCSKCHREYRINSYIWCAVGGVVGFLAGLWMGSDDRIVMIENVLVGVFGAFIGGEFIVSMFSGGVAPDNKFHASSLAIAVATAVVMLLALRLMRRVVGPLRAGKPKAQRHY